MLKRTLITILLSILCALPLCGQSAVAFNISKMQAQAKAGSADAQTLLSLLYFEGAENLPQDYDRAFQWGMKAALQGDVSAMFLVSYYYANGYGVAANIPEANDWLEKFCAADGLNKSSFFATSSPASEGVRELLCETAYKIAYAYYYSGNKVVGKDYITSARWCRRLLDWGYSDALPMLVEIYQYGGYGVSKNYAEVVRLIQKPAEGGNLEYELIMGNVYYKGGFGITKDLAAAARWYRKAAAGLEKLWAMFYPEEFDSDIANDFVERYWFGKGLPQNREEALYWYKLLKNASMNTAISDAIVGGATAPSSSAPTTTATTTNSSSATTTTSSTTTSSGASTTTTTSSTTSSSATSFDNTPYHTYNSPFDSQPSRFRTFCDDLKDSWDDWWGDRHSIDNTVYGELLFGYAISDNQDPTLGVNLGFFKRENYGRLGLHTSLSMMGGPDSWGLRAGPLLRFGNRYNYVEWQLYAGVGPHWDTVDHNPGLETTCYFSWEAGVRANFNDLSEDRLLALASVSLGCQFVMDEIVPTIGLSLWPALLFDDFDLDLDLDLDLGFGENYYTLVGEFMSAFGDGALMGASLAWMPSKLGWYASMLGAVDANGNTFTTGPVWSMREGIASVYAGLGNVAGDFGFDVGIRGIGSCSLSLGFQSNTEDSFITIGCGFAF